MKTKSPLQWFGSDSEVAGDIASLFSGVKHVTIPFVGGAGIIPHLRAQGVRGIVANDKHWFAINFYKVASGEYGEEAKKELLHRCRNTLSHPAELENAKIMLHTIGGSNWESLTSLAWAFWALCWVGRKGKGGTKDIDSTQVSVRWTAIGGNNASRLKAAAGDLEAWAESFKDCEWLCWEYQNVLTRVKDKADCGLYCDPPWVDAGRVYANTFTEKDHTELRGAVERFKNTRVVMRYGDHPLIRDLYGDWSIIEASSRTQSNAVKGELWITRP